MHLDASFLALDTGSPVVSLALGRLGGDVACRTLELRRSSEGLLSTLEQMIREAGDHLSDLGGIVVLNGPGSFTGLRVGLSSVLGLHQALGLRCTAVPTLPVLARAAGSRARDGDSVIAAVNALRGELMTQTFSFEGGEPQAVDAPSLRSAADLAMVGQPVIGFELAALEQAGLEAGLMWPAPPLAPFALDAARHSDWDPGGLVQPIYFRAPAVTPARR